MSEWKYRLAEPADAEAFAAWAAKNQLIDEKDLKAGMVKNNPTVLTFVVEKDGRPVAFAPIYLSAVLAHLGFDPDAAPLDKARALNMMRDGLMAFLVQFGVRELVTLSKPEYSVAQWAMRHGFEQEPRNLFRLDFNSQMGRSGNEALPE